MVPDDFQLVTGVVVVVVDDDDDVVVVDFAVVTVRHSEVLVVVEKERSDDGGDTGRVARVRELTNTPSALTVPSGLDSSDLVFRPGTTTTTLRRRSFLPNEKIAIVISLFVKMNTRRCVLICEFLGVNAVVVYPVCVFVRFKKKKKNEARKKDFERKHMSTFWRKCQTDTFLIRTWWWESKRSRRKSDQKRSTNEITPSILWLIESIDVEKQ